MTWDHEPPTTPPNPADEWLGAPPTTSTWGGAPTPPPERSNIGSLAPKRTNPVLRYVVALVVVIGLFGLGFGVRSIVGTENTSTTIVAGASNSAQNSAPVTVDPGVEPIAYAASVVSPSVVLITTSKGLGSGVVYGNDLVMTNAHVVEGETTVTVRNSKGEAFKGEVLGADTGTDIAVVRVTGLEASVAKLATDKLQVGQIAVAVGSPFGLEQTVTSGIVSALNRPVDNDKGVVVNMVQTDASINPGNSGGALANRNGEIIGINSSIYSKSGENNGIGFAIPIATAKRVADKIVGGQAVTRAGLGLSGPSTTPSGDAGAYVQSVTGGGAADKGGIKSGDLIISIEANPIHSFDELRGTVNAYSPGDTVTVQVIRSGVTQNFQVTLGALK